MGLYRDFEMTYISEGSDTGDDTVLRYYIDAFSDNDNEEGCVVATITKTVHGDIVVDWHNNGYRMDDTVLSLIEQAKNELR